MKPNGNLALLEKEVIARVPVTARRSGPACRKCAAPDEGYTVCRACGYYAKLDEFVEIDRQMEGMPDEEEAIDWTIPSWVYGLVAVNIAIIIESVLIALLLPQNTYERLALSLIHLSVGLVLLITFQVRATFLAIMDDLDVTAADCMVWPPKAWQAVAARLPDSSPQFVMASLGCVTLLMSVMVIRSIPYRSLLSSGEPPVKYESAIMKSVSQAGGTNRQTKLSMRDSLKNFTDKAAPSGAGSNGATTSPSQAQQDLQTAAEQLAADGQTPPGGSKMQTARCIVVGYLASDADSAAISSIVVATASRFGNSRSKFEILGTVSVAGTPYATELANQLAGTQRSSPFVESHLPAIWVEPKIRCEIDFQEQGANRQPMNLKIKELF